MSARAARHYRMSHRRARARRDVIRAVSSSTQRSLAVGAIGPSPHCSRVVRSQDASRSRVHSAILFSTTALHSGLRCAISASTAPSARSVTIWFRQAHKWRLCGLALQFSRIVDSSASRIPLRHANSASTAADWRGPAICDRSAPNAGITRQEMAMAARTRVMSRRAVVVIDCRTC
jgi:hypothetical protein